jgi:hypothetical protein
VYHSGSKLLCLVLLLGECESKCTDNDSNETHNQPVSEIFLDHFWTLIDLSCNHKGRCGDKQECKGKRNGCIV